MSDRKKWSFANYAGFPWWYWWRVEIGRAVIRAFEIREDREIARFEEWRSKEFTTALESCDYDRWNNMAMSGLRLYGMSRSLPWFPVRVVLHYLERLGLRSK